MGFLKNSNGKLLLNNGKPIKGNSTKSASIMLADDSGVYRFTHFDMINQVVNNFYRIDNIFIDGHIGDIIMTNYSYIDDYDYYGVKIMNDSSMSSAAFLITDQEALIHIVCFIAGTKITLANGKSKNIEDVVQNDLILGYDGEKYVPVNVLKTFKHKYTGQIYKIQTAETSFDCTWNHPIYSNGKYIEAKNLKIGDNLLVDNKLTPILKIDIYDVTDIDVYNLDVDTTNNYIANSCLVHNKPS